jgi:hypothetical protein
MFRIGTLPASLPRTTAPTPVSAASLWTDPSSNRAPNRSSNPSNPGMQAALSSFNWSKLSRLLPWLGAAILIAGIVVFLIQRTHQGDAQRKALNQHFAATYKAPPTTKTVPLSRAARITAGKFVIDAVQRKNLAEAWTLVAPEMKAGYTLKTWLKGDIPVVPFPAALSSAPLKVDLATAHKAILEVALVPKEASQRRAGGVFWLNMRTVGTGKNSHWVVTAWVPRYSPPVPTTPGQ